MSKEKENNLTVKILALIIAIVLWSYIMDEENPVISIERNVNVNLTNLASLERQSLIVMEPKDAKINVKISGKRKDVNDISEKDIIAIADLSGYSEGNHKVSVYVEVPNEVKIVDYSPKEISFNFEKLIKNESTVVIETTGKLPSGYVLGEPEIKPQSVYIEGPRSLVNEVSKVIAFVDLDNQTEDINITRPIKLVDDKDNDVRGVDKEQNVVDIFIPVYQSKKVPIELQTINELPVNYEVMNININPSTIEIKGKKEALAGITSIKTKPIDIYSLVNNSDVEVDLEIPDNVNLVNSNKKVTITLNIEESKMKTFDYTLEDIMVKNVGPELNIAEEDLGKSFQVTVKGSSAKIESLEKEDLDLELDLSGLDEGTHHVNIVIKGEEGISILSLTPESLEITLKRE